jgi:hypothetical protein
MAIELKITADNADELMQQLDLFRSPIYRVPPAAWVASFEYPPPTQMGDGASLPPMEEQKPAYKRTEYNMPEGRFQFLRNDGDVVAVDGWPVGVDPLPPMEEQKPREPHNDIFPESDSVGAYTMVKDIRPRAMKFGGASAEVQAKFKALCAELGCGTRGVGGLPVENFNRFMVESEKILDLNV